MTCVSLQIVCGPLAWQVVSRPAGTDTSYAGPVHPVASSQGILGRTDGAQVGLLLPTQAPDLTLRASR